MTFSTARGDRIAKWAVRFLGDIERKEWALLVWGVVSGRFSKDELDEAASDFLVEHEADVAAQEVIEWLIEHRLLFPLTSEAVPSYRSRMAEGVRLLSTLRQWFPSTDWLRSPTLVSDFRFALRPRVYPRRDQSPDAKMLEWSAAGVLSPLGHQLLAALLMAGRRDGFRLSGFQCRAVARMLSDVREPVPRGMIVTVGTGSGKTLAFYAPALTLVGEWIATGEYWTKALALYPRNELLKDQFGEAYREARRLDAPLLAAGRRKLLLGAFFGDTPYKATPTSLRQMRWRELAGVGFECPFATCLGCGSKMVWRSAELARGEEALFCVRSGCETTMQSDEVILTRNRMLAAPPDVLFTTTETLNQRIGDDSFGAVFGVGVRRDFRPRLMLLDEVHTYTGTTGAQAALLLRRWRHAVRRNVHFTGLSATLRNASEFFAQLTGLLPSQIEEIAPLRDELEAESMEYLVALRGDAGSRTALLSTSIQAAMLLGRILDPRGRGRSEGLYGSKVFAFTDDLDVTNRFYHNLLDAEGWRSNGTGVAKPSLASLRDPGAGDSARFLSGQSWRLASFIGHPAGSDNRLRVGRTSSQDQGVNADSDVVVATASLEVGFNDPDVGAVIQHKAPRDAASFLQRKGRAGRSREMRPWTVVSLSDYGRDRAAYLAYERLFDPSLDPRHLPIRNRYVLRMQATFAFMEWLGRQLPAATPRGRVYSDLTGPVSGNSRWHHDQRIRQRAEAEVVERLLSDGGRLLESLRQHLADALVLPKPEVDALLWQSPRGLLTSVLPTALRRLKTNWTIVRRHSGEAAQDLLSTGGPLPDFIPPNLFTDLNLPEVTIDTGTRTDVLAVDRAIRTLAPGSVTRRFAVTGGSVSHWIAPDLSQEVQDVFVERICAEFEELGTFHGEEDGVIVPFRCVRPWLMKPQRVPSSVSTTTRAALRWHSQLLPHGEPEHLELPPRTPWSIVVAGIEVYCHGMQSNVEIRRFAVGSLATIRRPRMEELRAHIRFVSEGSGERAAVGFVESVDALHIRLVAPDLNLERLQSANPSQWRGMLTAYYRHLVGTHPALEASTNTFQRDWLQQVYLSSVIAWAVSTQSSLRTASESMTAEIASRAMAKVLRVIFEAPSADADADRDADADEENGDGQTPRVLEDLLHLIAEPYVVEALADASRVFFSQPDERMRQWCHDRYMSTVGAALLSACQNLCPDVGSEDLVLDWGGAPAVDGVTRSDPLTVWITESTIGGGGIIEQFVERYATDPRRFFRLVESALAPGDSEVVDRELGRVLDLAAGDASMKALLSRVRGSSTHADLAAAIDECRVRLLHMGVAATHAVMSALAARVLRPGSAADTDEMLHRLWSTWNRWEADLGVEVDPRVFAYLMRQDAGLDSVLSRLVGEHSESEEWRARAIYGLLWPRGHQVRAQALQAYNSFCDMPEPDRFMLSEIVRTGQAAIDISQANWLQQAVAALTGSGSVRLSATPGNEAALKSAVLGLASQPLEDGFLHLYPRAEGLQRDVGGVSVELYLPEAVQ